MDVAVSALWFVVLLAFSAESTYVHQLQKLASWPQPPHLLLAVSRILATSVRRIKETTLRLATILQSVVNTAATTNSQAGP